MTEIEDDRLYSSSEAAALLGMRPESLHAQRVGVSHTKIPWEKIKNVAMYRGADLRRYLAERAQPKIRLGRRRQKKPTATRGVP